MNHWSEGADSPTRSAGHCSGGAGTISKRNETLSAMTGVPRNYTIGTCVTNRNRRSAMLNSRHANRNRGHS